MHRDCMTTSQTSLGEILAKNSSSSACHSNPNPVSSSFYGSSVGRNGVLPQAFDQFFDNAYASAAENTPSDHSPEQDRDSRDRQAAAKISPAPAPGLDTCRDTEDTTRGEESCCSPKSSTGNNDEKCPKSSSKYMWSPIRAGTRC